jgi:hypothetical protein
MSEPQKEEEIRKPDLIPTVSAVLDDGSILETVFRPEEKRTLFVRWNGESAEYLPTIEAGVSRLVPYSPRNNLLAHEVVLLPSEPEEYGSEAELLSDVRVFIHRYVDISALFEEIASYYVLFTWIYDAFNEVPYLRVRGDYGSGKTRFLQTVGSLCYKPLFASGASTVSPIFRILDSFRGTLVIDEGDFRASDEKAEIVKILNNGNARGFPVLRSEATAKKEFDPRAFAVFGPKLIATRSSFEDKALESRCITEEMGLSRLREDVPINLGDEHKTEALCLRNKLLLFRFRNLKKSHRPDEAVDRTIEPRLSQIFSPLLSIIDDPEARKNLLELARRYNRDLVSDRGMDTEAQVLEVIRDLGASSPNGMVAMKEIASLFIDRHGEEFERKVTPKWIGSLVRRKLNLHPYKSNGVYVVGAAGGPHLQRLYEKFGITATTDGEKNPEPTTPLF